MKENEDYELIPAEGMPDAWAVRILKGDYVESVIVYNSIAFNEVKDCLTFSFSVISSPDDEVSSDNEDVQSYAAKLLEHIIERGLEEGFVQFEDREEE